MKKQYLTTFLLCTLLSANSLSQGIDFGRGEVTVTVPSAIAARKKHLLSFSCMAMAAMVSAKILT